MAAPGAGVNRCRAGARASVGIAAAASRNCRRERFTAREYNPAMRQTLASPVLALAAAVTVAQERAPQNDSIRKEDLRADLFFLAGDSLRGRLTDTEENRAAADFIRSRFERLGLTPAG